MPMCCIGRRRVGLPPTRSVARPRLRRSCPVRLFGARRRGWSDKSCANEGGAEEEQTACESWWASALRCPATAAALLSVEMASVQGMYWCSSHLEIRIHPSTAHRPHCAIICRSCLPVPTGAGHPAGHCWPLCWAPCWPLCGHPAGPSAGSSLFIRLTSSAHSLIGSPNSSTPVNASTLYNSLKEGPSRHNSP